MKKNILKRYGWLNELEKDLNSMNEQGWYVSSLTDIGNRIMCIYEKEFEEVLNTNTIQDGEDTVVLDTMEVESTEMVPETSWDSEGS